MEQLTLRLPKELREKVRHSAFENRRSVNSEMIVLMEQALTAQNETAEAEFGHRTPAALETRAS